MRTCALTKMTGWDQKDARIFPAKRLSIGRETPELSMGGDPHRDEVPPRKELSQCRAGPASIRGDLCPQCISLLTGPGPYPTALPMHTMSRRKHRNTVIRSRSHGWRAGIARPDRLEAVPRCVETSARRRRLSSSFEPDHFWHLKIIALKTAPTGALAAKIASSDRSAKRASSVDCAQRSRA